MSNSPISNTQNELVAAAETGSVAKIRQLVQSKVALDGSQTQKILDAYRAAEENGHEAVVELLIQKFLVVAVDADRLEVVKMLIESESSDGIDDLNHSHAFIDAVIDGQFEMVKYLIDSGVDPNGGGHEFELIGWEWGQPPLWTSPLTEAVLSGNVEMVRLLMEKGANDSDGNRYSTYTPLFAAVEDGNLQIVNILLAANMYGDDAIYLDDEMRDAFYLYPLDVAIQRGRHEIVKQLILHCDLDSLGIQTGTVEAGVDEKLDAAIIVISRFKGVNHEKLKQLKLHRDVCQLGIEPRILFDEWERSFSSVSMLDHWEASKILTSEIKRSLADIKGGKIDIQTFASNVFAKADVEKIRLGKPTDLDAVKDSFTDSEIDSSESEPQE